MLPRHPEPPMPLPGREAGAQHADRLAQRIARGGYPLRPDIVAEAVLMLDSRWPPLPRGAARMIAAIISQALLELPPRAAMLMQLSLVEQLPDAAIAAILGADDGTVAADRRHGYALLSERILGP